MAKNTEVKTKVNEASVESFLNTVKDEEVRKDCFEILKMMKQVTKEEPKMWGGQVLSALEVITTSVKADVKAIGC